MTSQSSPPVIHPTDDLLLFLGDVRSETDAAALVEELQNDAASWATGRPGTGDGHVDDDPFAPAAVAATWQHLQACGRCLSRRDSLCGAVGPAILSSSLDGASSTAPSSIDKRVAAAVAEFVPNNAATPQSFTRPAPVRRRWFERAARPSGLGAPRGGYGRSGGSALTRPWAVGLGAVALLATVGVVFALRPRATERSAVGTVARAEERVPSSTDTTGSFTADTEEAVPEFDIAAAPEAAAETEAAAAADAAVAAEAAPPPPVTEPVPPPSTSANDRATGATGAAVVEPSRTEGILPPPPNTRARAVDQPAPSSPPPAAKAKRLPNPEPAVAAASPAIGLGQALQPDIGTFLDAASALDRFASQFPVAGVPPALSAPTGSEPTTTLFPGDAAVAATPSDRIGSLCPSVTSDIRAAARIGTRSVVIVRLTDGTGRFDAVVDALTCSELTRRPVLTPAAAASSPTAPPPTAPPPTAPPPTTTTA